VRPFLHLAGAGAALGDGKWQISKDGAAFAFSPRWRGDSNELVFQSLGGDVMGVELSPADGPLRPGVPLRFFSENVGLGLDMTADGKRFLTAVLPGQETDTPLTVVSNWQAELKK